jgi:hypothetical protein
MPHTVVMNYAVWGTGFSLWRMQLRKGINHRGCSLRYSSPRNSAGSSSAMLISEATSRIAFRIKSEENPDRSKLP